MEKFQITNDLSVFWSINEKDGSPYRLSDKTVRVFVTHPRGRMDVTDEVTIQDNVISWLFRGSRQRYLGTYQLTAEIQATPADRVIKKDIPEAFALVSSSQYEQTEVGRPDINETGNLTLATSLDIFQIMPIVPQIGPNGNWWVDGVDTGKPSRGEPGPGGEGTGLQYAIERTVYPTRMEAEGLEPTEAEITEEERAYNRETAEMAINGQPVFISIDGWFLSLVFTSLGVEDGYKYAEFSSVTYSESFMSSMFSYVLIVDINGDARVSIKPIQTGGSSATPSDMNNDFSNDF